MHAKDPRAMMIVSKKKTIVELYIDKGCNIVMMCTKIYFAKNTNECCILYQSKINMFIT